MSFSYISKVVSFLIHYGVRAFIQRVVLETWIRLTRQETIQVVPPGASNPVYLRKATLDAYIYSEVFLREDYRVSLPFCPQKILDCGGNIGLSAVYFALRYPSAQIVVLEPVASNYEMLVENTRFYPNIHHQQCGVWSSNARLKIINVPAQEQKIRNMGGFATRETSPDEKGDIDAVSINVVMDQYGMDVIDLLKMDIESGEKKVFALGHEDAQVSRWLLRTKAVIIELHGGCKRDFDKMMLDQHFKCLSLIKGESDATCVCFYLKADLIKNTVEK